MEEWPNHLHLQKKEFWGSDHWMPTDVTFKLPIPSFHTHQDKHKTVILHNQPPIYFFPVETIKLRSKSSLAPLGRVWLTQKGKIIKIIGYLSTHNEFVSSFCL